MTSSTATSTASSAASTTPATSSTASSTASSAPSTAPATSSTANSTASSAASTAPATSSTATSAASSAASTATSTASSAASSADSSAVSSAAPSSAATTAPELVVQFLDTATGKAIKPALTLTGAKLGATYDLAADTTLPEYTFDAAVSGALTGTYTAGTKTINLCFTPEPKAGTITVDYLDQNGQPLLPASTINGQVNDSYALEPTQIPFYTYTGLGTGSLPISGKLGAKAGDILLTYQADTAKAEVEFIDGTTKKVLETYPLSGLVGTASTYSPDATINFYEKEGYEVAGDDFPDAGAYFLDPNYTPKYAITLTHRTTTLTPDSHVAAPALAKLGLTKTVTETIDYVDADGQELAPASLETVTFTRNATIDDVTDAVTYSAWKPETKPTFTAAEAPAIDGYTPEEAATPASAVTPTTADLTERIVYDTDSTTAATTPTTAPTDTATVTAKTPTATAKTTPVAKLPTAKAAKPASKPAKPIKLATTKTAKMGTKSVATGKTLHLIRPTTTKALAKPMAMATVPVYNAQGQIIGSTRSPLAKPTPGKHFVGKTGSYRHLAAGLPQTNESSAAPTGFLGLLMLALSGLFGFLGFGKQRHEH